MGVFSELIEEDVIKRSRYVISPKQTSRFFSGTFLHRGMHVKASKVRYTMTGLDDQPHAYQD